MGLRFEAKNLKLKKKLIERANFLEKKSKASEAHNLRSVSIERTNYQLHSMRHYEACQSRDESKKLYRAKLSNSIHRIKNNMK